MNDILSNPVKTNMEMVRQNDEDNDMKDYNSKACIICGKHGKDELWFQCFMGKSQTYADAYGQDVGQASHRHNVIFVLEFSIYIPF